MFLAYNLYVFVEGEDDERFFENILNPLFKREYYSTVFWKYAQKKPNRTKNFIKSIDSMNEDYLFVGDLNNAPCITAKKEQIKNMFNVKTEKIIIVIKEIESWYVAGIDGRRIKFNVSKGIKKYVKNTETLTKEVFNQIIPKKTTRTEFILEIIEKYDLKSAREKNKSLKYILKKWKKLKNC